jgi:hypothetical protein
MILRCQWHRWIHFHCLNETMESFNKTSKSDPTVSLTPRDSSPRWHYHWWSAQFSQRIRSHLQNNFSPWIRALGKIVWWKKTEGQKSYDPVPLTTLVSKFTWAQISERQGLGFIQVFTPLLYNKGGDEPQVKPGVWHSVIWALHYSVHSVIYILYISVLLWKCLH